MNKKSILTKKNPRFNLTRALIVRSRKNAGETFPQIARTYSNLKGVTLNDRTLSRCDRILQTYIDAGLVKESELHKHED